MIEQETPPAFGRTVSAGRLVTLARRHGGVGIGFFAQALQYGAAVLLLPFIVTRLDPLEVGIWYVFVTIQGLATLADFGLQPTIARGFAAGFAGARELRAEGFAEEAGGTPNAALILSLLAVSRRLYLFLSLAVLAVLCTAGLAYVSHLLSGEIARTRTIEVAWLVFASATSLNIYFLWISPLLLGAGRITSNYLFIIANRGTFAVLGIAVLVAGGGLLGVAIAAVAATIIARLVAVPFHRAVVRPFSQGRPDGVRTRELLRTIWPNARRMGLVALGAFLTTRFSILALSTFAGLGIAARYAISFQLISAVVAMAQLPMQVAFPRMVAARVRSDRAGLRRLFLGRELFYLAVAVAGIAALVGVAPNLLALIGSRTDLLPTGLLLLLALVLLLEGNHANAAFVISTGNRVPFVVSSIAAGSLIAIGSTASVLMGAGVLGVILSQGLVQLAYNNWKWPLVLWRELAP